MGKEIQAVKSSHGAKRQKFDKVFKLNAVKLLQAGQRPVTQLALELGIRRNLLYKWAETLAAHGGDMNTAFNGPGHNKLGKKHDPLKAENARLKRELVRITEERDILKKAEAYFTKVCK
ncbi:MAG: transposase [Methylotenera sp.]